MPYLIDGNNLIFALMEVGPEVNRVELCELLAGLVDGGERVRVVFDGPAPKHPADVRIADSGVLASFCPGKPADGEIIDWIKSDSAPKLLTVVSSDREIRTAAGHRKCKCVASLSFAKTLLQNPRVNGSGVAGGEKEPPQKETGLSADETSSWLSEFGLNGD